MPDEPLPSEVDWTRRHLWHIQPVRDLLLVGIVVAVVWAGYALRYITIPLIVALGLAYLVEPLVRWISTRFRVTRVAVVGGVTGAIVLGAAGGTFVLIPSVIRQSEAIVNKVQSGALKNSIGEFQAQLPEAFRKDVAEWLLWLESKTDVDLNGDRLAGKLPLTDPAAGPSDATPVDAAPHAASRSIWDVGLAFLGARSGDIAGFILSVLSLLFAAALVPFYFYFFSVHFPDIVGFLDSMIPDDAKTDVHRLTAQMDAAVAGFVRGRIVIAAIMAVLFTVGWAICGVPYALTLGVAAGVLAVVPYLSGVVLLLAVPMLAVTQLQLPEAERMSMLWVVLGPAIVFSAVQALEGNVLTPIIAGRATNLDPVTVFVAILAGGSVAGVYGMLLAIPIAACAKILLKEVALPRIRAWAAGTVKDPLPLDDR
ncbi:MAG: AI-2E family transporter [Phycisphaerae bacterium]|nr:AI-2E family transporter [Phycisphaerae bacterium]